jgi:hypothetical protein
VPLRIDIVGDAVAVTVVGRWLADLGHAEVQDGAVCGSE